MKLDQYLFTNVRLSFSDGQVITGYIDEVTAAEDNDNGEQSITIVPREGDFKGRPVEVFNSEIRTVDLLTG